MHKPPYRGAVSWEAGRLHLTEEVWLGAVCWAEVVWLVLSCSQQQIVCGLPGRTHRARTPWVWELGMLRPGRKGETTRRAPQEKA